MAVIYMAGTQIDNSVVTVGIPGAVSHKYTPNLAGTQFADGGEMNALLAGKFHDGDFPMEIRLLESASRIATTNSDTIKNVVKDRLTLLINVESTGGGGVVRPSLQILDPISGNYKTVWTALSTLTTTGLFSYYFADGATSASGVSNTETLGVQLPADDWRLQMTHADTKPLPYSAHATIA